MPIISVIMPTQNREDLIVKSIKSITSQIFKDWELLVVNDHSTDNTKSVVTKIGDPRIKYFYLDNATGPGAARDFGIRKAQGEIIILADSDDISLSDRFKKTVAEFKKDPKLDVIYGISETIKDDIATPRPTEEFNAELLKCYNFISNPTAAFRRKIYLDSTGYDYQIKTSEDYDLWLTFLENGAKFKLLDRILVQQIIHDRGITKTVDFENRKKNLAYVRQKHNLPVPDFEKTMQKIHSEKLKQLINNPGGLEFWFGK